MIGWSGEEPMDRGLAIRGAAAPSRGGRGAASLARWGGALVTMLALGAALFLVVGLSWGFLWLSLGRAVAEPGNSGARWLLLGLAQLAIPGAMVGLLPLVRRLVPVVLQLMAEGEGARAGRLDKTVAERLEPGEHVLASMALDEVLGPCEWAWSLVVVWMALVGALSSIVWAAVLAQFEPVMAAVYGPATVVGLTLAVWALQALVSLDVLSELVVGILPPLLYLVLTPMVPLGMAAAGLPLKILMAAQTLWVVVRLLSRPRKAALYLTTRGLRRVEGSVLLRQLQVGPVLRPVMICAGPAPLGERWVWSDEGGGTGVLFPIMASARAVARVAASSGIELKVRPDARKDSGATLGTVVGTFVLLLWYVLAVLPPAHLTVSLVLDLVVRSEELASSPGPVMATCAALASQHPLALVPRCMGAQQQSLAGDLHGAADTFDEVEDILGLVPGVTKATLPRLVRVLVVSVERDLALRQRLWLAEALGWEPAGEALAPYHRAMVALFGWTGGDLPGQLATAQRLLEQAHAMDPDAAGPAFMLAYLHLNHWDRGVEVEDSLPRLLERAEDDRLVAKRILEPLAGGGPWAAAAEAMTSVRALLSEEQVALGLVVGRVEEGALATSELAKALALVRAVSDGDCMDGAAFGRLAVSPPDSAEDFLGRWRPSSRGSRGPRLRAANLWAQAEGAEPLDETTWLPKLMRELVLKVPSRLASRVRAEPSLAFLLPLVDRKAGGP